MIDNVFLQEKAAEVRGVAIQDQTLSYVEVVAEYEDEHCYLWNEITILFTNIRYEVLFVFETTLFLNSF